MRKIAIVLALVWLGDIPTPLWSQDLAGQRQERNDAIGNIKPTSRIGNRIENRVPSRIRNRIDRSYDHAANPASAINAAADRARTAANTPR